MPKAEAEDVQPQVTPVAHDDAYSISGEIWLFVDAPGVLANDEGVASSQTIAFETTVTHGSVSSGSTGKGSFKYLADTGFTGTDSFTYCIYEQGTCVSDVATVTITVVPPVAHDDAYSISAQAWLFVDAPGVLANDEGLASSQTIAFETTVTHGSVSSGSTGKGSFKYLADTGFTGTDSFTYCIYEQGTCLSDVATVTITVKPFADDDSYSTPANTALHVASPGVAANDDGFSATYIVHIQDSPQHGSLVLDPSGQGGFTYTPDPAFLAFNTFTYCLKPKLDETGQGPCASNVATVQIYVNPVANDDAYSTPPDTVLHVDAPGVVGNDLSGKDPLGDSYYVEGLGQSTPQHGQVELGHDGHITYNPDPGFVGEDAFTYCLNSVHLPYTNCESNVATVTITVAPVAHDDAYSTPRDTVLHVDPPGVTTNDVGFGSKYAVIVNDGLQHGSFVVDLTDDGGFAYGPPSGFVGTDTFTYCILLKVGFGRCDSNVATVTITVTAPPDTTTPSPSSSAPHPSSPKPHPSGHAPGVAAVPPVSAAPVAVTTSGLPNTGADVRWPMGLGTALLLAGLAIAFAGRKRGRRSA
ncbi:MAG TPA: Ig-like domain-containing protein [Jatrophihabitantaceae bacterium]|nr:Ig-like domain-containing protein [Jatrophihabitantaceae bacterium]